mmetsp:Transcript_43688/g.81470  ORF Transcript_43688/g.81470 Transcript_43688/m.81470 type:complete len:87 (-) Transcript_43688:41-301(-)
MAASASLRCRANERFSEATNVCTAAEVFLLMSFLTGFCAELAGRLSGALGPMARESASARRDEKEYGEGSREISGAMQAASAQVHK